MQLRWYWAHYAASAPYRVLVEASIRAAGWLRDGRSGDRRALNDRWHRRCTPAGAFGGAARQWRTGHHVALPHPPDSGRGLRLMWPFRKSAETRSSSGGYTMPTPADIIRHLPACGMDTDAAWDAAMKSRLWDDDITIEVSMAVYNAFPFGMWKRGDKAGARMAFKDAWPAARAKYGDQVEVSLGHHKASRAAAVLDAVRTGMIEQRAARLLLPRLTDAEFAGMQRSLPSQTGAFAADPSRQRLRAGGQLVHRAGVWPPSGGRQISWPIISGPLFTRSKRRGIPLCATLRNS